MHGAKQKKRSSHNDLRLVCSFRNYSPPLRNFMKRFNIYGVPDLSSEVSSCLVELNEDIENLAQAMLTTKFKRLCIVL